MLKQSDLSIAIEDFARTTDEAILKAKRMVLPSSLALSFSTSKLSKEDVHELASSIPTGGKKEDKDADYIYIFRIAPSSQLPHETILEAFNAGRGQMLAGLGDGGQPTAAGAYLATFIYRAGPTASGMFLVDVVPAAAGGQTYLVADFVEPIEVLRTEPALITVEPGTRRH